MFASINKIIGNKRRIATAFARLWQNPFISLFYDMIKCNCNSCLNALTQMLHILAERHYPAILIETDMLLVMGKKWIGHMLPSFIFFV